MRPFRGRADKTKSSILSPSFLAKRAPGGASARRPADWAPPPDVQARLAAVNVYDAELYAWAAARELARIRGTNAAAAGLPVAGERWRDFEWF